MGSLKWSRCLKWSPNIVYPGKSKTTIIAVGTLKKILCTILGILGTIKFNCSFFSPIFQLKIFQNCITRLAICGFLKKVCQTWGSKISIFKIRGTLVKPTFIRLFSKLNIFKCQKKVCPQIFWKVYLLSALQVV